MNTSAPQEIDDHLRSQPPFNRFLKIYSEKTRGVVFFCGAGASQSAGLPTWQGFIDLLVNEMSRPPYADIAGRDLLDQLAAVSSEEDAWKKVSLIKQYIGDPQFESAVKEILTPSSSVVPNFYPNCWSLKPNGLLTVNLDRFASAGFRSNGDRLNEVFGVNAHENERVVTADSSFVINLHGTTDTPSSWVLTAEQKASLLENKGYEIFLRLIFARYTVVFYGISATDTTVSGQLSYLRDIGVAAGDHFWIVRAPLTAADQQAANSVHAQLIELHSNYSWDENFKRLCVVALAYKSVEPPAHPVLAKSLNIVAQTISEIGPHELLQKTPDQIRTSLVARSSEFFDKDGNFLHEAYAAFCNEFDAAIHLASRVRVTPPNNTWLGYRVISELGSGVFGKVYAAENENNEIVAIKIAREEVRDDRDMLNSFRRGVESMSYLTNDHYPGVSTLIDATELPPSIIMKYIEGVNLEYAISNSGLPTLYDRLKIFSEIARIVQKCHQHPKGILHRDLRPSNIMLSGEWWQGAEFCDVWVLDFDLSWFFGAKEKSFIMKAGAAMGYLAPEQLNRESEFSSRNALVDVYGLCMLLYYLFSEKHPIANASFDSDWPKIAFENIKRAHFIDWRIVRRRIARLIEHGSAVKQLRRPPLQYLIDEITALIAMVRGENPPLIEYFLEEIFCRLYLNEFEWDFKSKQARSSLPSGVTVVGRAKEDLGSIDFTFEYLRQGFTERKGLAKYIDEKSSSCSAILEASGLGKVSTERRWGGLLVSFSDVAIFEHRDIAKVTELLERITSQFSFR